MNEKQKQTVIIGVFMGFVCLLGAGSYRFMIAADAIRSAEARIRTEEKKRDETKAELDEIESWVGREAEMEENKKLVAKLTRRLPERADAPGFLNALLQVLRSTGMIQEAVRQAAPTSYPQYTEIPFSVKGFGRYHELGQFLTFIEQNPDRFMRVKSMSLVNKLDRPSIHPIELEVATFTFKKPTVQIGG